MVIVSVIVTMGKLTPRGVRILWIVMNIKWRSTLKSVTTFRNTWPAIWRVSNSQKNQPEASKDPGTPSEQFYEEFLKISSIPSHKEAWLTLINYFIFYSTEHHSQ